MIGDRLDTDVLFAHDANISSLLTFTGVTHPVTHSESIVDIEPTFTIDSIGSIAVAFRTL